MTTMSTLMMFFGIVHLALSDFFIDGSGHFPVAVEDVGIRFFLSVVNTGRQSITVLKASDPECCWEVEPGDTDCQSMELFGGFPMVLRSGERKNISYVFSNLYPLDRIGVCNFFLQENNTKPVRHQVRFDTTEKEEEEEEAGVHSLVGISLFGSDTLTYQPCEGVDVNKRNNCRPFNCAKRYNGFRNFYRKETRKCERIVTCRTKLGADNLPITAFDMERNRCKSLLPHALNEEEERVMQELMEKSELAGEFHKYDEADPLELVIDCNNGRQEGRHCRCDDGWRTVSVATEMNGIRMDWCSKKVKKLKRPVPRVEHLFLKYVILLILLFVCCSFSLILALLMWRWVFRKLFFNGMQYFGKLNCADKLPYFPFEYNPMWKIGSTDYNSNLEYLTQSAHVDKLVMPEDVITVTKKEDIAAGMTSVVSEDVIQVKESEIVFCEPSEFELEMLPSFSNSGKVSFSDTCGKSERGQPKEKSSKPTLLSLSKQTSALLGGDSSRPQLTLDHHHQSKDSVLSTSDLSSKGSSNVYIFQPVESARDVVGYACSKSQPLAQLKNHSHIPDSRKTKSAGLVELVRRMKNNKEKYKYDKVAISSSSSSGGGGSSSSSSSDSLSTI